MGLKKNNPGCSCCGEDECSACADGVAPDSLTVTLSGFANDSCSNCADYNGTYVVDHLPGSTTANTCFWEYRQSSAPCLDDPDEQFIVQLIVNWAGTEGFLQINAEEYIAGIKQWGVEFKKTVSSKVDCDGLSSESVPYDTESITYPCDASSATCTVTS